MQILLRMQESGQKRMKLSEKSLQYNYDTITFCLFFIPIFILCRKNLCEGVERIQKLQILLNCL